METVAPADDPEPEIIRVSDLHCMYMYIHCTCMSASVVLMSAQFIRCRKL